MFNVDIFQNDLLTIVVAAHLKDHVEDTGFLAVYADAEDWTVDVGDDDAGGLVEEGGWEGVHEGFHLQCELELAAVYLYVRDDEVF